MSKPNSNLTPGRIAANRDFSTIAYAIGLPLCSKLTTGDIYFASQSGLPVGHPILHNDESDHDTFLLLVAMASGVTDSREMID